MNEHIFKISLMIFLTIQCRPDKNTSFICPPCDQSCDLIVFSEDGFCPHCNMTLIPKTEENYPKIGDVKIGNGKGFFLINTYWRDERKLLKVSYYKPSQFSSKSKLLIIVPGAGRNADSYRDAWIDHAEKYITQ